MAPKVSPVFPGRQRAAQARASASWAVVGIDTSMSSLALVAIGWDSLGAKMTEARWLTQRWLTSDDDYFQRLADAANIHKLMFDVLPIGTNLDRVFVGVEEPIPLGMINAGRARFESGWLKQQCEVSGAVMGSLYRYGYRNLWQVNNQTWKADCRKEGAKIPKGDEGKWGTKAFAMERYGMPDLPDLVKAKNGSKIPRPESGYGAKAKSVQPEDVYDAAGVMTHILAKIKREELI